ncbi:MAG: type II toxin-antitoxin system HicA family toxin [Alphaproteobacteria bacterium]
MGKSWTSAEILKALEAIGFERVSQKGSHIKLRNTAGKTVIVPHPRKDMPRGTLRSIERLAGIKFE